MAPPAAARPAGRPWNAFWAICLVTSCLFVPVFALLLCSIGVGASHGLGLQLLLFLWTFCGFNCTRCFYQQLLLVSVPAALAAAAPPSWGQLVAVASMAGVLLYGWNVTGPDAWRPRPAVYRFISDWAHQWFAQAELRGDLPDGCTARCCFAFHPHGVICAGFNTNGVCNRYFERAGRVNWLIDFRLRYGVPSFRWLCDALHGDGRRIHDMSSLKQIMGAGENIALVAGGVSEVSAYSYGKDATDMSRRKGLVKYCLQYGYRMFPVYSFGETTTYKSWSGLPETRLWIGRATAMPPVLFVGWPWLPYLPRKDSRVVTYIGAGLDLPHIPEPTGEDVDRWHARYLAALRALFLERREEAGFPGAELEIL